MATNPEKFNQLNINWKTSSEDIVENAEEGIAFFNPQMEVVFWNPYVEKITGKKGAEIEGKKLSDILPCLTSKELTNQLINNKQNVNKHEDDLEIMVIPYYDKKNQLTGGVAILKENPQEETDHSIDFKTIFQSLPGLYVIISPEKKILATSDSYLKATYTKRGKIINKNLFDFLCLHNSHPNESIEALRESIIYSIENRVRHTMPVRRFDLYKGKESGYEEHHWSISTIPVLNEKADVIFIILNIADVTVEFKTEKEVTENRKRFELIAASANVVAWEYNYVNDTLWLNENFHNQFKYNKKKSLCKLTDWEEKVHPSDRGRVMKTLKNAFEAGDKRWIEEYRFRCGDGSYSFVRNTGYTLLDRTGAPKFMIGTIVDLTKNKNDEEKIKAIATKFLKKNQELKKANEVLDTFVYAAAHDLKSPVNNLKSLMDLVQRSTDDNQRKIFMDAITNSVGRLDKTIKSLTEIIEIQNNKNVTIKEINLPELIDNILLDYNKEIENNEIDVIKNFNNLHSFRYNEAFIVSILMNLISNAIKYRSGKRKPVIKISSHQENDYLIITFQDNGIGIDLEKYKDQLFRPFKRFTQEKEGKGIGLHLIKSIVEKNGGKIVVESQLDQGSIFKVYLREYEVDENGDDIQNSTI
jgi:PAS domain S-box-containing protein